MSSHPLKVYCAGPLFNEKEREEMTQLAHELADRGFATFLPHRDGLEMMPCIRAMEEAGMCTGAAASLLSRAVFALDVYQVLIRCEATVVNLNGRVPDEGAVAEAAMAWAHNKPIVGYKADCRSVFGGQDNPLLVGLFNFRIFDSISQAVDEMSRLLNTKRPERPEAVSQWALEPALSLGKDLWNTISTNPPETRVAHVTALLQDLPKTSIAGDANNGGQQQVGAGTSRRLFEVGT